MYNQNFQAIKIRRVGRLENRSKDELSYEAPRMTMVLDGRDSMAIGHKGERNLQGSRKQASDNLIWLF
jgi:hypothetical protein